MEILMVTGAVEPKVEAALTVGEIRASFDDAAEKERKEDEAEKEKFIKDYRSAHKGGLIEYSDEKVYDFAWTDFVDARSIDEDCETIEIGPFESSTGNPQNLYIPEVMLKQYRELSTVDDE